MPKFDSPDRDLLNRRLPNYEKVARLFVEHGSSISPSMLQGWWVGWLASGAQRSESAWLEEVSDFLKPTQTLNVSLTKKLHCLFDVTFANLHSDDMAFTLYLPEEDEDDTELRIEGFCDWCQGLLQGFGQSGLVTQGQLSDDAQELLSIFAAFSQASYDDTLTPTDNDQLLEKLIEHAKVGALSLFFEYGRPPKIH